MTNKLMKTIVRCPDRMVFEVDPVTLKAKTCSYYDAYCYIDPRPDVLYIELDIWNMRRIYAINNNGKMV